jgi:hypothetical protein
MKKFKTNSFFKMLLATFVCSTFFSCKPAEKKEANGDNNKPVLLKLPAEIDCNTDLTHTYTDVCDTTEATAKSSMEKIFKAHFKCKPECKNGLLTIDAVRKGACVFNVETGRTGSLYDITVTLKCRK